MKFVLRYVYQSLESGDAKSIVEDPKPYIINFY